MRLGEILIERNLISQEDLERALELQKERGDKLGKILVDLGFIAMRDVLAALAEQPHPDEAVAWGGSGIYRLRLLTIRILYEVNEDTTTVYVINVAVTLLQATGRPLAYGTSAAQRARRMDGGPGRTDED